jgi:hypothetical protein
MLERTTGAKITLAEAEALTASYQTNFPGENACYFVGADHVDDILKQEGCIGIRVYKGLNKTSFKKTLVLIGVNADGHDMTEGFIVDKVTVCPDNCPDPSTSLIAQ